jgi:tetratricopeptide (TPR) repeat protein
MLSALRQYRDAIETLKQAVKSSTKMPEAHYNLGYVLSLTGHKKEAIQSYKNAIMLKADFAEAYVNLAVLYLREGQRELALQQYANLKSVDPILASKLFDLIYQDKIISVRNK